MLFLDTNIWSLLVEGSPDQQLATRNHLKSLSIQYGVRLGTSAICIAECLVGARTFPDAAKREPLEIRYRGVLLDPAVYVVPVSDVLLDRAAQLRADIINQGGSKQHRKHLADAIIAVSCLSLVDAVMVTRNVQDFAWVPGLTVVQA
jgi:predicted nucleic acid-binding protein